MLEPEAASFLAACALGAADLGALALFARRLGRPGASLRDTGLLAILILSKLALLALGVAWLCRRPWNDPRAMTAGLLLPFLAFIARRTWVLLRRSRPGVRVES